jgi:Tol biopolymer transport system component
MIINNIQLRKKNFNVAISSLFILSIIALVGCGSGGGGDTSPDPTPTPAPTASPTPPPIGNGKGRIFYQADENGVSHLFTINPDGSGKVQLTSDADANETEPSLSPDGTKVVFLSRPKNFKTNHTIKVINIDGTGLTSLTDGSTRKVGPRWFANGTKIVFQGEFTSGGYKRYAILAMNADGSNVTRISKNLLSDYTTPDVSPDSTKITCEIYGEIYVMNADGSGEVKITGSSLGDIKKKTNPLFSPDGKKILYTENNVLGGGGLSGTFTAYTMNVDGSGKTKIAGDYCDGRAWSLDGTKILVSCTVSGGARNLSTVNPDGTGATTLSFYAQNASW